MILIKLIYYFTGALVISPHYSTHPDASVVSPFFPTGSLDLPGAGGSGSGGISLVGCETLFAGVVGTCVSNIGVATSDAMLTRAGGAQQRLVSSLSCDVGTSALRLRRTV